MLNKIFHISTKIGCTKYGGINEDTNVNKLEVNA